MTLNNSKHSNISHLHNLTITLLGAHARQTHVPTHAGSRSFSPVHSYCIDSTPTLSPPPKWPLLVFSPYVLSFLHCLPTIFFPFSLVLEVWKGMRLKKTSEEIVSQLLGGNPRNKSAPGQVTSFLKLGLSFPNGLKKGQWHSVWAPSNLIMQWSAWYYCLHVLTLGASAWSLDRKDSAELAGLQDMSSCLCLHPPAAPP